MPPELGGIDNKEQISKEDELTDGLDAAEKGEVVAASANIIDKTVAGISPDSQKALDYSSSIMKTHKTPIEVNESPDKITIIKIEEYSVPLLDIKQMQSGDCKIPDKEANTIRTAIFNLGEFQTIKIIGCTDASVIETENAIIKNKDQFENIKTRYIQLGGKCPSYDDLLKSPQDPQNTILGYTRAMQGVMSLGLNLDQMQKVDLGNKLGNNTSEGAERGFEVETNYTKEINDFIDGIIYTSVYNILGSLNQKNISFTNNSTDRDNVFYAISNLQFSTEGPFQKIYNDVFRGLQGIIGENPELEQKARKQTEKYLTALINVCGGDYQNGTWSGGEKISNDMYFMISAIDPKNGFLSKEDFIDITKNGNISILENKITSSGQSLKDYIATINQKYENNGGAKITSVYKGLGAIPRYNTTPKTEEYPQYRNLSDHDYKLLGLYFSMKNKEK